MKGKVQQVPVRLRILTGGKVKLLGTKNANVAYKGVTVNENIYTAEGSGPNLLRQLKSGKFFGGKVNVYVPPGIRPGAMNGRSLSYSVRPRVEEELSRLQRIGIIQSSEFLEWATPIVPILKPEGTVRISGGY
ncbi:hypothetical protein X801_08130 [Opisthorchis viverrini]|uniref:Uncharacterized protein n=1 Tax=Opisthorchis viverrini TaxID=6198 RepID=A0A1S8WNI1_OPIVI|nr:hypothetical protein X801_08130 [Opisthorchis viverrini]